jgi:carbonic anhydrase/acetyltransferase-like protein (isoleucine patch superfamily)
MVLKFEEHSPQFGPDVYVAPTAVVVGRVTIGERSSVWFGSVVRGDIGRIVIGWETNVQDLTMIHTDADIEAVIGDRVTIGHRAILHGCVVEDECLIGMGSIIQNRAVIGRHSIVASGSVVREDFVVPPESLVAGVPAIVKRKLTPEEIAYIVEPAKIYVREATLYRRQASAVQATNPRQAD